MTRIKQCTNSECKSDYQDKKYGNGNRVHNVTSKDKNRCTVCGKES